VTVDADDANRRPLWLPIASSRCCSHGGCSHDETLLHVLGPLGWLCHHGMLCLLLMLLLQLRV